MEAMLFVYFANILPQIGEMLYSGAVTGIILWVSFVVAGGVTVAEGGITVLTYTKILKISLILICTVALLRSFIPDRDTMYLMAGAYIGQQVLTSEVAKDAYEIIGLEVKNILKEKKKELQGDLSK